LSNTVLFVMDIKTDFYTISLFKMDKRKRKELCLKEKIDLIDASDGKSQRRFIRHWKDSGSSYSKKKISTFIRQNAKQTTIDSFVK
jgi:hypothetical protein